LNLQINNAGVSPGFGDFQNLDDEAMRSCVEINSIGSLFCSKYAMQVMKKQDHGGHIFQMEGYGSHGQFRKGGPQVYGMTKYGLSYLGQALAVECEGTNVGVHRIYPGLTLTDFITKGKDKLDPAFMGQMLNTIGDTPENVAKNLCPKLVRVEGNNRHYEHISQRMYAFLFIISPLYVRNRFYDKEGNRIKA